MGSYYIDIAGEVFGDLTAIEIVGARSRLDGQGGGNLIWSYRCVCGHVGEMPSHKLRRRDRVHKCWHIQQKTPPQEHRLTFKSWCSMRERCRDEKNANYGGRGITVCERWLESFAAFLADMGPRPSRAFTIDRIDVNGNYEPGNCRWATWKEQHANRRNTVFVDCDDGAVVKLVDLATHTAVSHQLLYQRLKLGWDMERALTTPARVYRQAD